MEGPNLPLKPNICCGYPVDAGESIPALIGEIELDPNPHAGDVAICLNCGALLVYLDEENNTRFAELFDLHQLSTKRLKLLKKARKFIRQKGRHWPEKKGGERFSPN